MLGFEFTHLVEENYLKAIRTYNELLHIYGSFYYSVEEHDFNYFQSWCLLHPYHEIHSLYKSYGNEDKL